MMVRIYSTVALLRYQAQIVVDSGSGRAALTCWHTDHYELRDGCWQVVWSHATARPPPEEGLN